MSVDIDRIHREYSLVDVAMSYGVKLEKDGGEWRACCPFHKERTASFTIFNSRDGVQRMHCFGCGAQGDVVDFVGQIKGLKFKDAANYLTGGRDDLRNVDPKLIKPIDVYEGITPAPTPREIEPGQRISLYNPKRKGTEREWGAFIPSLTHEYRTVDGELYGYVLRHNLPNGKKETPMVMWVRLPNGDECWSRYPFPKPRPLYGVEEIAEAKQVIVVEGEKCRDALIRVLDAKVVAWAGGTQGVKHTDWSPLAGKDVVVWGDFDEPGWQTVSDICSELHGKAERVRFLEFREVI